MILRTWLSHPKPWHQFAPSLLACFRDASVMPCPRRVPRDVMQPEGDALGYASLSIIRHPNQQQRRRFTKAFPNHLTLPT